MYRYLITKKCRTDDKFYRNGNGGSQGFLTKSSRAELEAKGIHGVFDIPKWVQRDHRTKQ